MEVAHAFGGTSAAAAVAGERRGTDFDPELVGAFLSLSDRPEFWHVLEQDSVQTEVLAMKPPSRFDRVSDGQVETVCEVIADFTDIASQHSWNPSQIVADLAVGIARQLGLRDEEVTRLRRVALVHDIGKVAVPSATLQKQERLSESEWEVFRLHPYYTERVLSRVGSLSSLAHEAAAHHESLDGQGYHRRLAGEQIPLGGRIMALADTFAVLSRQTPGVETDETLQQLGPMVGPQLDPMCFEALVASLDGARPSRAARRRQRPGNLTEREAELLRELAKGLSNKQIANSLVISQKTVEHHLENIYNKLGISSRTSAVVFAVQNGIVA